MTNLMSKIGPRASFIVFLISFMTACGGGSSNSGGPPPAPEVVIPTFSVGTYTGTLSLEVTGDGLDDGDPATGPFSLEVSGTTPGQQQVRIAFNQFSGTSAIGPDGEFTIPSGDFIVGQVRDPRGRLITCTGRQTFSGTFVGNSVSGTVTGPVSCSGLNLALTLSGTFEASLGSAKFVAPSSRLLFLGNIKD